MRAILVLFMVAAVEGGLGFDTKQATSLYGTYTMMVYLLALPGGSWRTAGWAARAR